MSTQSKKTTRSTTGRRAGVISGPFNIYVEAVLSSANLGGSESPPRLNLPGPKRARKEGPPEPPLLEIAADAARAALCDLSRKDRHALEDAYTAVNDPYFMRRRLCRLLLRRVRDERLPLLAREAAVVALTSLACVNGDTGAEELSRLDLPSLRSEGLDPDLLGMVCAARDDEPHPVYGDPADDRDAFAKLLERALARTQQRRPDEISHGSVEAVLNLASGTLSVRGINDQIPLGTATARFKDLRLLMEKRQSEPERGWVAVLARKTSSRPSISRAGLWKLKEWLTKVAPGKGLAKRLISRQQSKRVRLATSALVLGG